MSVVIPCLNEEQSVGQVVDRALEGIARIGVPGEVIVVDNGSTDRSAAIAAEHGARVIREQERGYGAAIRRGFREARHSILAMGDADLTYDFTKLDELVKPILAGDADFVIGHRLNNILPGSMPSLHRFLGNPFFSIVMRLLFWNATVRDPNCGLRAIAKKAYRRLGCVTTGMEFASEMVVRAFHEHLRIQEREIIYHPRVGDSKLRSFEDGWRHLRFMVLHSPTVLLLIPGILCWVVAFGYSLWLSLGDLGAGSRGIPVATLFGAGIMNIVSVQLVTMGLLAKAYAHLSGLRNDPLIARFYGLIKFETATLFGGLFLLAGLGLASIDFFTTAKQVWSLRRLFLSATLGICGVQIMASAYLFSIMALPRHPDRAGNGAGAR
ncbi:MAG TPA: glycosyltransferase family 2 protein [Candidatus Methanoperedens sp.]|nr:glycosyltransferase family 2 protein [Candidatus Methanoperedens sp.]